MPTCDFAQVRRIVAQGHLNYLGRSRAGEESYLSALRKIKAEFATVEDALKVRQFGYEGVRDAGTGKLSAKAGRGEVTGLVLRKNDFPYNLGEVRACEEQSDRVRSRVYNVSTQMTFRTSPRCY